MLNRFICTVKRIFFADMFAHTIHTLCVYMHICKPSCMHVLSLFLGRILLTQFTHLLLHCTLHMRSISECAYNLNVHCTFGAYVCVYTQVLYFLEPIRCGMQNHLCARDVCLACELGFLFRMLDRAKGRNCQATNFLRAFRTLKDVGPLGLLISSEEEELSANLGKLIQKWNRFVLQQLNQVCGSESVQHVVRVGVNF